MTNTKYDKTKQNKLKGFFFYTYQTRESASRAATLQIFDSQQYDHVLMTCFPQYIQPLTVVANVLFTACSLLIISVVMKKA